MSKYVAILVVCNSCVGVLHGELSFDLTPVSNTAVLPGDDPLVPDFNDGTFFTFDLLVIVTDSPPGNDDDWMGGTVYATLSGPAEFFQHPEGGDTSPDEMLIEQYPAIEFDSYFSGAPGAEVIFAEGPFNEPTSIWAGWADGADAGNGTYPIARYTAQWLGGQGATLTVDGIGVSVNHEGPFFVGPFTVTIPEPGTLVLLAVGALAALGRVR